MGFAHGTQENYTVAVQFWNGSHTWNPGQSNRYTVAIRGWNVIPRIRLSPYTVATPVSIQFWNVIPNFRICESQTDPIPELNRYTVAIQCWNGSHRWNPGELNRYTVAVQFWNGIQKMNPAEFNRYTVAVQFWNGIRTWNPGEFNRYTVAVQFRNGIQKMNPGEFNRYTVAVQFWNGIRTWNPGEFNRYTVAVQFWNGIQKMNPGEFNRYICFSFSFAGSPSGRLRSCPLPPPDSSESSGLLANSERLTLVNLMGFCWGFCLFFFLPDSSTSNCFFFSVLGPTPILSLPTPRLS